MNVRQPLCVALLWHMHQPEYRDPQTGVYRLPWVRLHALKDYSDMAAWVRECAEVRVTFNFVPSLLQQLEDYARGQARDPFLELSAKEAADLNESEREWLLTHFFRAHPKNMIEPYPRYAELWEKRGRVLTPKHLAAAVASFTEADLRDLQVWFNLAWCGYALQTQQEVVRELIHQGRGFQEEDKRALLAVQAEVLRGLTAQYRRLAEQGQVELTTSPFYHPILPLLCRMEEAREARPGMPLPENRQPLPEDADEQIRRGLTMHERVFGQRPRGLWPPEGSVSDEALARIAAQGIEWVATDEQILAWSVRRQAPPSVEPPRLLMPPQLYRPYAFGEAGQLAVFFRDHDLSDRLGFVYSGWPPERAAQDFLRRLQEIHAWQGQVPQPLVVSVILDGENAWEHYPHNGADFLRLFYRSLVQAEGVRLVTFSEYLDEYPVRHRQAHIFPGSWIDHDFHVWVGHEEDNTAWEHLFEARAALVAAAQSTEHGAQSMEERGPTTDESDGQSPISDFQFPTSNFRQAWEHLYIAEGSDWFWWYGDEHASTDDATFDALFRDHLAQVYRLIGQPPPASLAEPIKRPRPPKPVRRPQYLFTPVLDGRLTTFFEWRAAGLFDTRSVQTAMHRVHFLIEEIKYGFDEAHLYLCLTADGSWSELGAGTLTLELKFAHAGMAYRAFIPDLAAQGTDRVPLWRATPDGWKRTPGEVRVARDTHLEIGVPLAALRLARGAQTELTLTIQEKGEELERWPAQGAFILEVPGVDFEVENWWV